MFAIICKARKGAEQGVHKLALVDRTKSRTLWWTDKNPSIIEQFASEAAAQDRCLALA
ncbi:hypothetical protein ACOI1H_20025 [Loktanella sp. DJP18]|uniref:hypothetical protein n=1 Tax=Loktanella sp. DJP18 TaxID=3409788 RepID=UPI003BB599F0